MRGLSIEKVFNIATSTGVKRFLPPSSPPARAALGDSLQGRIFRLCRRRRRLPLSAPLNDVVLANFLLKIFGEMKIFVFVDRVDVDHLVALVAADETIEIDTGGGGGGGEG